MTHGSDINVTEHISDAPYEGDITYHFSTYYNNPEHLPILTLDGVKMGGLELSREQVIAWLGKSVVAKLEDDHTPDRTLREITRDYEMGNYGEEDAA
jgi:hypothetical protein